MRQTACAHARRSQFSNLRSLFFSKRPDGAAGECAFEIEVALIAGDEFAQGAADAGMQAREVNHARGEGAAEEMSVEALAHACGATQFAAEVCAPTRFISFDLVRQVSVGE